MSKKIISSAAILIAIQFLFSCHLSTRKQNQNKDCIASKLSESNVHVMTKPQQDSLLPEEVLKDLIAGNERFKNSNVTQRDHSERVRKSVTGGQFPKAFVLSCVDSRVPVEDVFDQRLGDVFVGRVAGNFVNTDLLGSMEFACKVAGSKLILVMGHQHCGAIKGAIDDVHLGNLSALLENIKPAVEMSKDYQGEKSSKNEAFVKTVNQNNIKHTIAQIRAKSEILREMENKGEIKIIGAYYSLLTGKLEFIN